MSRNRSKITPRVGKFGKSHIRIIGGEWRGRKLSVVDSEGLRPTGDRLRETLFNWLTPWIPDARCLDLFAGTGALGLEALSRGAKFTHFIELNKPVAEQLKGNLARLKVDKASAQLSCASTLSLLTTPPETSYDLIFLDPPFAANHWNDCIRLLSEKNWLSSEALVYVESPKNLSIPTSQEWQLHRESVSGDVRIRLYKTFAD